MKIKAFDIGTYSIKIIESSIEKRMLHHHSLQEVVYTSKSESATTTNDNSRPTTNASTAPNAPAAPPAPGVGATLSLPPLLLNEEQIKILKENMDPGNFDGKYIFIIPACRLTSRYLTLPVNSRKKADLMLPYQLERDLPFALSEVHFAAVHLVQKNQTNSLVSITGANHFDQYFKQLAANNILPDYISSELSVYQSFVERRHLDGPALIVDIGHETTKSYFIYDRAIVSNHLNYVGGKLIDENLTKYYQLVNKNAIEYKHQHAFFLTEKQYAETDPEQQELAKIMKQIFAPLIRDLTRFELGNRISHGKNVSNIYLTGGSANIKNICNFFTQHFSIKTQMLESFENVTSEQSDNPEMANTFALCNLMVSSFSAKNPIINFRVKQYTATSGDLSSLYSNAFLAVRVLIIAAFLAIFFVIERIILIGDNKTLDTEIAKILSKPTINISKVEQKKLQKKPEAIFSKLKKKEESLLEEIDFLQKASKKNALNVLFSLQKNFKSTPSWEIEELSIEEKSSFIKIKLLDPASAVPELKSQLASLQFPGLKVTDNLAEKRMIVEFTQK
ncbi:MAG: pilus assembly protein PilM [Oligoflexia bacterium]|nr:pilus assembly protein PilM [Oligoflexia bacterium]